MSQGFAKSLTCSILALLLSAWFLLAPVLLGAQPAAAQTTEASIPTTTYNGAPVPDWNNISFSSLPGVGSAGAFQIPDSISSQLGYNPSRFWDENTPLDQVLSLGDVADGFGLQSFSLGKIAQITGLNLNNISLDSFSLLKQQSIASLVQSIPNLAAHTLNQVPILKDLVSFNLNNLSQSGLVGAALGSFNLNDYGNISIGAIAQNRLLGPSSLSSLDLKQYSLTGIPGLSETPIAKLPGWQTAAIGQVPGLSQVPFSAFPKSPASGFFGYIALDDVTYGPAEHHTTPTKFSITGSDQVGFNYQCAQQQGCAYLELNSPSSLGVAGDPNLHGAQWIKGGTEPGGQMVKGGHGILSVINGGKEPTGRLPFGPVFKVVLTNTTESTGTGNFGLYFRICHHGFVDLGCTPYFIGPVPWLSSHEKGIIFVGETQGTAPDNAPSAPPASADVQQQIDALIDANEPDAFSTDGPDDTVGTIKVDADCLAKIIAKAAPGESSAATATVPQLLAAAQKAGISDRGQIAYILATAETETNFRPRDEDGGYCGEYDSGCYYGRGDVQITYKTNYQTWANRLSVDLVGHPELANRPDIAARIAVEGMRDGTFTGRRLGTFIHGNHRDFIAARHIVNDSDKSSQVAQQAENFLGALNSCSSIAATPTGGGAGDKSNTSADHPGQLITHSNGTAVEQKIVNSINSHYGESSADGPDAGNEACAFEVNRVLQAAIGHKIGSEPNLVTSVEDGLRHEGTQIGAKWAHAGDVVVLLGTRGGHIGFCLNDGCSQVLSNSSSKARFRWVDSLNAYNEYYGAQGRIYRINN